MFLARRMLPHEHWFELGLINYGMSTGTTATGFVLLRLVDPELESGAAEDYALAAPLSSPFIGGGMITVAMPLLVLERAPLPVTAITIALIVAVIIFIGQRWNRRAAANQTMYWMARPIDNTSHWATYCSHSADSLSNLLQHT